MAGHRYPLCLLVLITLTTFKVHSAPPTELTLDVSLASPYDTISELYIGGMTKMEVKVSFPSGTTAATIIELLPSTNVTIMALGAITVTPATKIASISGNTSVTRYITDATIGQKVQHSTRAVINLGNVVVSDLTGVLADYTYTIQFEAFVVSVQGLADNASHWISAGVEYDNSNSIWVGQIELFIRTGTLVNAKTPSFSLQNVTQIKRMSVTPLLFEAWIPYPNSFVAVEAISLSTTNDHLRVVALKCISSGSNYEFGTPTMLNYPLLQENGVDCAVDGGGARRIRLDIGTIPNKGSRNASPAGLMDKLQFQALVNMKGSALIYDSYPFGVGVEIDGTEVWVATMNITAIQEDPPITFPIQSLSPSDGLSTKKIGEGFLVKATIEIPKDRGLVTAVFKVETIKVTAGVPGIIVSQGFVANDGANVQCVSITTTQDSSIAGGIKDIAYLTVTAANHGQNTTGASNDNWVDINIALVGVIGKAVDGASYDVKITSNISALNTQTTRYKMNGTTPFDTNTNHTFELSSDCGDNQVLSEDATFDLILTVLTQRGTNPESLQIEFPIPANVTDGMFAVCGIEVINIGKNLVCFNPDQFVNGANYTTLPDGTHEYVSINIQPACNVDLFSNVEEDKLVLRIKGRFKDGVTITKGMVYWFGIGSKYTSTQIWVAQYAFNGQTKYDFGGPVIIKAINVLNNNYTMPGNYSISRSFDGNVYDSLSLQTGAPINNGTHSTYNLQNPILGRKAGLITENCQSACGVDYDFTYTSLKDYVDIFGDDSEAILTNMLNVFDHNQTSCMNLPVQGNTPPVFWARINITLLNINLQSFTLNVTGEGISCERHGAEKVLQVSISYPVSSSVGRFHGDVKYCKNTYSDVGLQNTCGYTCMCPNTAECSEVIIFLANSNSGGSWKMCDLNAANI